MQNLLFDSKVRLAGVLSQQRRESLLAFVLYSAEVFLRGFRNCRTGSNPAASIESTKRPCITCVLLTVIFFFSNNLRYSLFMYHILCVLFPNHPPPIV